MKVLLVDDEPSILTSTSLLLEGYGCQVVTLGDAARVLEVLREEMPDLLIQDVRMPGLDLESLLDSIRSDAIVGRTPIVLFSAGFELGQVAAGLGVDTVLEKPFQPSELADLVGA